MLASQNFLNHLSGNIDRYDAYIRDGLAPWTQQIDTVHQLVNHELGIVHDR